jgi:hypothetical protein
MEQVRIARTSARRSSGALFLSLAFLLRLADALASGGWLAFDQAIFEAERVQVLHRLSCPAQGLFLGLCEKCGTFLVQFLDALDRCLVCHLSIFPVLIIVAAGPKGPAALTRPVLGVGGVTGLHSGHMADTHCRTPPFDP